MNFELVTFLVLAFASYRLTRILVIDTLFEGWRAKFHAFLVNRTVKNGKFRLFWEKTHDLTSCTWCTGAWLSVALYSFYVWQYPWDLGRIDWIIIAAVAGVQGLLHSWESDEE